VLLLHPRPSTITKRPGPEDALVNNITIKEAERAPHTVLDISPMNSVLDTCASHSLVFASSALMHGLPLDILPKSLGGV
jgi:hypothetical protein